MDVFLNPLHTCHLLAMASSHLRRADAQQGPNAGVFRALHGQGRALFQPDGHGRRRTCGFAGEAKWLGLVWFGLVWFGRNHIIVGVVESKHKN